MRLDRDIQPNSDFCAAGRRRWAHALLVCVLFSPLVQAAPLAVTEILSDDLEGLRVGDVHEGLFRESRLEGRGTDRTLCRMLLFGAVSQDTGQTLIAPRPSDLLFL